MHYYEVAPRQIIRADQSTFTYSSEQALPNGSIVIVEVGKKSLLGVVVKSAAKPSYVTKPITSVLLDQPLPKPILELALWLSQYYATPLATVLQTILPTGVQKKRRQQTNERGLAAKRAHVEITLTSEQTAAIATASTMTIGSALLYGVTGSGKTAVYIELAKKCIQAGQSVIVLVPEIALTPQLVSEFSRHFDDIILTHSRQTETERHLSWLEALHSKTPRVVIGPRSALFLPLQTVGLIIIDEAHEPSFKQEKSPRYSALRAASILAKLHKAKLILGSATPSITDYFLAQHAGRPIIRLSRPAQSEAIPPTTEVVDMTKRANFKKHRFLSDRLIAQLETTFASGHQALIFHNRRGSASTTLCENCGWPCVRDVSCHSHCTPINITYGAISVA